MTTKRESLDALIRDAHWWHEMSEMLGEAKRLVDDSILGADELSQLGEDAGLVSTYSTVQSDMARYLDEGSRFMDEVSEKLIAVSKMYEETREHNERMVRVSGELDALERRSK